MAHVRRLHRGITLGGPKKTRNLQQVGAIRLLPDGMLKNKAVTFSASLLQLRGALYKVYSDPLSPRSATMHSACEAPRLVRLEKS